MEATKEQGAAVFGTAEMESQRTAPKKRNNRKNIVIVVGFNSQSVTRIYLHKDNSDFFLLYKVEFFFLL